MNIVSLKVQAFFAYVYTGYKQPLFLTIGHGSIIRPYVKKIQGNRISIGNNCDLGKNLWLSAIENYGNQVFSPSITIGDNCTFGDNNHIGSINYISIGEGLLTGQYVLIEDHQHSIQIGEIKSSSPSESPLYSKGGISIGNNVWIGDKVTILGGVTIGDGAIIGANSVVLHDVPPHSVAVGAPARVIEKKKI